MVFLKQRINSVAQGNNTMLFTQGNNTMLFTCVRLFHPQSALYWFSPGKPPDVTERLKDCLLGRKASTQTFITMLYKSKKLEKWVVSSVNRGKPLLHYEQIKKK